MIYPVHNLSVPQVTQINNNKFMYTYTVKIVLKKKSNFIISNILYLICLLPHLNGLL